VGCFDYQRSGDAIIVRITVRGSGVEGRVWMSEVGKFQIRAVQYDTGAQGFDMIREQFVYSAYDASC